MSYNDGETTDYEGFEYVPKKKSHHNTFGLTTYSKKRNGRVGSKSFLSAKGDTREDDVESEGSEIVVDDAQKNLTREGIDKGKKQMQDRGEDVAAKVERVRGARKDEKSVARVDPPTSSISTRTTNETIEEGNEKTIPRRGVEATLCQAQSALSALQYSDPSSSPPPERERRRGKAGALSDKSNLPKRMTSNLESIAKLKSPIQLTFPTQEPLFTRSGHSRGTSVVSDVASMSAASVKSSTSSSKLKKTRSSIAIYKDRVQTASAEESQQILEPKIKSKRKGKAKRDTAQEGSVAIERGRTLVHSSSGAVTRASSITSSLLTTHTVRSPNGTTTLFALTNSPSKAQFGGHGELEPPILPDETERDTISKVPIDDGDSSTHSSIVVETYDTSENHASRAFVDDDDEGEETIKADSDLTQQIEITTSQLHHTTNEIEDLNSRGAGSPTGILPTPQKVAMFQLQDMLRSVSEAGPSRLIHTEASSASEETEFVTPGRPLPPRHQKPPLAVPRPEGPAEDEDDLAYYLSITGTGSSDEDETEWRKCENEIGQGVEPGLRLENANRKKFILRQPQLLDPNDSDDEIALR